MLSLSEARLSFHSPLPSFCSFSCCCFAASASLARFSLSAVEDVVSRERGWRIDVAE